jgi:hypothetical protein
MSPSWKRGWSSGSGVVAGQFGTISERFGAHNRRFGELEARLAALPTKTYMWGILGVLLTAYGCGLAALAVLK